MRVHFFLVLAGLVLFASCNSRTEAEKIVDKAIEAHGGDVYNNSKIEFDFRDIHYTIFKTADRFEYIREFSDSTGTVVDLLNNEGFVRTVNGAKVDTLSEEWIGKYSRSVNSVAYFAFLPYGLNDPSVFKELLGETELNGEKYNLIKVTFAKEGGGVANERSKATHCNPPGKQKPTRIHPSAQRYSGPRTASLMQAPPCEEHADQLRHCVEFEVKMDKDTRRFIRQWIKRGARLKRGTKHGKLILPNGRTVIVALTPSDRRALLNLRAEVRRSRADLPAEPR